LVVLLGRIVVLVYDVISFAESGNVRLSETYSSSSPAHRVRRKQLHPSSARLVVCQRLIFSPQLRNVRTKIPSRVLATTHHFPTSAGHPALNKSNQISTTPHHTHKRQNSKLSSSTLTTYLPSATEIAKAWIRSPPLVPMPGQSARLPVCGLLTSGRTKVVLDSRMKELLATGPVEKALPNCQPYSAETVGDRTREEVRAMVEGFILANHGQRRRW
jgi:hypothetical protein